jgi:hypothetical protein
MKKFSLQGTQDFSAWGNVKDITLGTGRLFFNGGMKNFPLQAPYDFSGIGE